MVTEFRRGCDLGRFSAILVGFGKVTQVHIILTLPRSLNIPTPSPLPKKGVYYERVVELAPKSRNLHIMSPLSPNVEPVTHSTHNRRVTSRMPNLM